MPDEMQQQEPQLIEGPRMASILYSAGRDLYRLPDTGKAFWLSVTVHPLPMPEFGHGKNHLGGVMTADAKGWRSIYDVSWSVILPGDVVSVPEDDPLIKDYLERMP